MKNAGALGISLLNGRTTTTTSAIFLHKGFLQRQTGSLIKCTRNLGLINLRHKDLMNIQKVVQHKKKMMTINNSNRKIKPLKTPKRKSTKNSRTLKKLSWLNLKKNKKIPRKFNPNLYFLKFLRQINSKLQFKKLIKTSPSSLLKLLLT